MTSLSVSKDSSEMHADVIAVLEVRQSIGKLKELLNED